MILKELSFHCQRVHVGRKPDSCISLDWTRLDVTLMKVAEGKLNISKYNPTLTLSCILQDLSQLTETRLHTLLLFLSPANVTNIF